MRKQGSTDHEDITQMGVHGKQDMQYMRSLSAAAVHRTPRYLIFLILIIAAFFATEAAIWTLPAILGILAAAGGLIFGVMPTMRFRWKRS